METSSRRSKTSARIRVGPFNRSFAIAIKKFSQPTPPSKDGPRVNEEINSRTILLIGYEGEKFGEIGIDEALAMAEEKGFDLVEVSPGAKPPVVKMMDYGNTNTNSRRKRPKRANGRRSSRSKRSRCGRPSTTMITRPRCGR
jgi:hypothetical protein